MTMTMDREMKISSNKDLINIQLKCDQYFMLFTKANSKWIRHLTIMPKFISA